MQAKVLQRPNLCLNADKVFRSMRQAQRDPTGSEGLMTSDWGNKVFIDAGKKVVSGIFVGCKDSESDKGDRIELLFNISLLLGKGRSDRLELAWPGDARKGDLLAVAMEWQCFKIAERNMIDCQYFRCASPTT